MRYYQDNRSRKLFSYKDPLNKQGEFVVCIGSLTDVHESVETISLEKGESCLVGTGLRVNFEGLIPIFSHAHHIHIERWYVNEKTRELMLVIANPSEKLTLDLGDEIAAFVLAYDFLAKGVHSANTMKDL